MRDGRGLSGAGDRTMGGPRRVPRLAAVCLAGLLAAGLGQAQSPKVLEKAANAPLPGRAVRFDYQSLDAASGRLYIAHMNADELVVFDTRAGKTVASLGGFNRVHGVLAVPALHRVYASVTGNHQVAAVDTDTLKTVAVAGPVNYPDGLAYAPVQKKIFVSDEHGGVDAVIDAPTHTLAAKIPLGGGAGNTVYDAGSGHILVAVHGVNLLVAIDPATNGIVSRLKLAGIENPHGIALDSVARLAFVAGEENHSLALVDLDAMTVLSTYQVGEDPDVLAYDAGLKRLYVAAESGTVTVFHLDGRRLKLLDTFTIPHAHTVAVDPETHLVYFPLEDVGGHPLLRILKPVL